MSDVEKEVFRQIGIDLINEYRVRGGLSPIHFLPINTPEVSAFIRSIQLHEKTKKELQGVKRELDDYKQKVSDAVGYVLKFLGARHWAETHLNEFIIPAPKRDPMTEVWRELFVNEYNLDEFIAAMDARGLEIREKGQ